MSQKIQAPKKPMNGYFRFQEEKMEGLKKANPEKSHKELMSMVAKLYNALDVKKKQVYSDAYQKDKSNYDKQYAEFVAKHGVPEKKKKSSRKSVNSPEMKELQ